MVAYIPNILTILRIALTFAAIAILPFEPRAMYTYLLAIFVVGAVSDLADGYIARKFDAVTDFGKVFDPLADKVLSFVFLVILYGAGIVPPAIVLLLIVRDLVIDSVRGMFTAHIKVIQAIFTAKVKTAATFVFIALALYTLAYGGGNILELLTFWTALAALAFSYISAAQYAVVFYREYQNFNKPETKSSKV
ncbi:CDP-diacylglycerol--glycerol-3-phosphate 3-phosphatidyltransferase [bacterium]|nr:CDP-diacylglycerol--glycerol-3-phosphate 3-phosphatidyltransferase [bacterium]|tara:strand:+ start:26712 stop:27290 length:579 start_codon:yes stop_codon:yes gene_type:complete